MSVQLGITHKREMNICTKQCLKAVQHEFFVLDCPLHKTCNNRIVVYGHLSKNHYEGDGLNHESGATLVLWTAAGKTNDHNRRRNTSSSTTFQTA